MPIGDKGLWDNDRPLPLVFASAHVRNTVFGK